MEPEKVAPEAISAPIPDDLKTVHSNASILAKANPKRSRHPQIIEWASLTQSLIERIASLEQQLAALKASHAETGMMWVIEARFKSAITDPDSGWAPQEVEAYSSPERAQRAVERYTERNTLSEWRARPYAALARAREVQK